MKTERHKRIFASCSILLVALLAFGCETAPPPPDAQLQIENIAKWYQQYRAKRGKPPKDEKAFLDFVEKDLSARGTEFDREAFLVSKRDGKEYVVNYGSKVRNFEKNVAVYEEEGYQGKKLIAFESVWAKEVEQAELDALLAGEN